MSRNISLYLKDILDNMNLAENFIGSMTYEEFIQDIKTSYAVLRCIEIMGEAAKNIPDSVRKKHPDIPWKEMAGMRDKVIPFYFGVDPAKVWLAVKDDIQRIRPLIQEALQQIQDQ
jgi:uncharacterized protein with HEPN domain